MIRYCPEARRPSAGLYGVFAVQNFWEVGYEREVRQGITLADVAKAQGARRKTLCLQFGGSSSRKMGIATFGSKW